MNLDALRAELLAGHPVTGAYSADNAEAAAELNAVNCSRNRTSLTGSQVINAIDATEWAALTDSQRQTVWNIVHLGEVNPFGVEATLMLNVFGGGSSTITALQAARIEAISRAVELGLGVIREGTIQQARAI